MFTVTVHFFDMATDRLLTNEYEFSDIRKAISKVREQINLVETVRVEISNFEIDLYHCFECT